MAVKRWGKDEVVTELNRLEFKELRVEKKPRSRPKVDITKIGIDAPILEGKNMEVELNEAEIEIKEEEEHKSPLVDIDLANLSDETEIKIRDEEPLQVNSVETSNKRVKAYYAKSLKPKKRGWFGAITSPTKHVNLIRMFMDGPDVSLKGSPTVSPVTAAL